jgi:hypothetical protein
MLAQTESTCDSQTTVALRTVAVVGKYAHHYFEDILDGLGDFDVVFVESIAHAFSKIKRVRPDLVVLCVSDHDAAGCHVLSMLALDRDTSQIPVLTHLVPEMPRHFMDGGVEPVPVPVNRLTARALN